MSFKNLIERTIGSLLQMFAPILKIECVHNSILFLAYTECIFYRKLNDQTTGVQVGKCTII